MNKITVTPDMAQRYLTVHRAQTGVTSATMREILQSFADEVLAPRLAQPATKASDGPAVPEGFHLATEEELKKLPENSLWLTKGRAGDERELCTLIDRDVTTRVDRFLFACPNTPEPTRQQQQLKELRQVVLDASEPEWIEHDRSPTSPIRDDEVFNWEIRHVNGNVYVGGIPSAASWANITHYRHIKRREPTTLKDVAHLATINAPKFQEVEKEPPVPPFDLNAHVITNGHRPLAPGEQWHRLDWTAEMLPMGCRPLLLGEEWSEQDECYTSRKEWKLGPKHWVGQALDGNEMSLCRTTRPLPPLPPAQEQPGESLEKVLEALIHDCRAHAKDIQGIKWRHDEDDGGTKLSAQQILEVCDAAETSAQAATTQLRAEVERLREDIEGAIVQLNMDGTTPANLGAQINRKIMQRDEWHQQTITRAEAAESLAETRLQHQRQLEARIHNISKDAESLNSTARLRIAELERELAEAKEHQKSWLAVCDEAWKLGYGQLDQQTNETPYGSILRLLRQGSPDPSKTPVVRPTLRPISEVSNIADGFARAFAEMKNGEWIISDIYDPGATHFADIPLPTQEDPHAEAVEMVFGDGDKPETEVKPAPFNESKWIWKMEWCRKNDRNASNWAAWDDAEKQFNAKEESK